MSYEHSHKKYCLQGFQISPTQTSQHSQGKLQMRIGEVTMYLAKTKALGNFAVDVQLIYGIIFVHLQQQTFVMTRFIKALPCYSRRNKVRI